jgi:hypothetical protein
MKLPNRDNAFVPLAKLHYYLLSYTHSVGQAKARFFREFGFDETNTSLFESTLLSVAQTEEVLDTIATPFGTKYIVDGSISTPVGTAVSVRTVWIIEHGDNRPRFVTAYPRPK